MRPSRYLAVLAAIFIVLFAIVLGFGKGSMSQRLKPKLGLDLVGGTTLTLVAKTLDGGPPSAASLEQARQIIESRVNGLGVAEAEVVTEGTNNIVVSVPGANDDTIKQVGTPAELRFRTVLQRAEDLPADLPAPSPSASPAPSGSAKPSASASPKAAPSPSASAAPSPTPAASPSPAATPSAAPSPSPSTGPVDIAKERARVLQQLGAAATYASAIQDPAAVATNPALAAGLEPFRKLKPAEVAVLPTELQFKVPEITCEVLNARPPGSIVDTAQQAVACEPGGHTKYLMDTSKVVGTDISSAVAALDSHGSQWVVNLTFNGDGTKKWTTLTGAAYNNASTLCPQAQGQNQHCLVAVVLDNTVVSAPEIEGVLTSTSTISGSFTRTSAQLLANQLKYGALPLTFDQGNLNSISATLGTDYLKAGLLAAGIGMLLVIVYAFFYYRLLGSVIFLSLILSGLLTFGMLVLLGRQIGFTLSLAGIAGFIVSLGVAADSFVIYFERLKDEIREGRSPRSAIPRAWARARRTIITANAVTVLAAVVLYLVGVGSVKGFAFALGLATMLDLVIVFLFRHPIMTMLARTPAFLSPRVSGLGRVLQHAGDDSGSGPARPKEA
jgi:preprotein translocase subunit SecD